MRAFRLFRDGMIFGFGILVMIGTGAVAVNVTGTMNTFGAGDLVSSSQINENFTTLKTAIESIEDEKTPPGAVTAFYRDNCPDGWTAADGTTAWDFGDGTRTVPDLQNRFVRGVGGSVALGTFYNGSSIYRWNQTQCHNAVGCAGGLTIYVHQMAINVNDTDSGNSSWTSTLADGGTSNANSGKMRPDNVGLLYCVKTP